MQIDTYLFPLKAKKDLLILYSTSLSETEIPGFIDILKSNY